MCWPPHTGAADLLKGGCRSTKPPAQRVVQPAAGDIAGLDELNLMRLDSMTDEQLLLRIKTIKRCDKMVSFIAVCTLPHSALHVLAVAA